MGKYDKVAVVEEEEEKYAEAEAEMKDHIAPDGTDRSRRTQLILVYLVFTAEAYVQNFLTSIQTRRNVEAQANIFA